MFKISGFGLLMIISVVMFLIQTVAYSVGTKPGDDNLREACRKEVSGRYLTYYDERTQAQAFADSFGEQIKKLEQELAKLKSEMTATEKALASASFDMSLDNQLNAQKVRKKTVEDLITDAQKNRSHYLTKFADSDKAWKSVQSSVKTVFQVFRRKATNTSEESGYPFELAFISTCPKFDWSCPLPPNHARALLKLFPENQLPEICKIYAKTTSP